MAISAPRPEYPYEGRRARSTGSGVVSELGQLRRALRAFVFARRSMAKDVAHPIAEAIPQIGDNFMRSVTGTARVVAILDKGQFRLRSSQNMIALDVDRRAKPGGSTVCHKKRREAYRSAVNTRCSSATRISGAP